MSRKKRHTPGERVLISYPKSGRTWFRYIFDLANAPVRLTHARATAWRPPPERLLIASEADGNRVVFLHRHPIDTAVSMYFQRTRRNYRPLSWQWTKALVRGRLPPQEMETFLNHPEFGVQRICRFNRAWIDYLSSNDQALLVRYEEMLARPEATLARVMRHFFPDETFDIASLVQQSTFSEMKKVEEAGGPGATRLDLELRKGGDPDSRKVRRGVAGGYRDYLSEGAQRHFETICAAYALLSDDG